ncbi:MAG: hypothetical protein IT355_06210 [Gemmatimonadaceae bacterium]|nr:hypothetical protein [Gemmatimonadaceae bacterium]
MITPLEQLLAALTAAGVQYIVVGGVAARAHGSSRLTDDLDIVYARDASNLERLVAALAPLSPYLRGAPPGLPFDWSVATLRGGLNFTLTTGAGAIDLLGEITGGGGFVDLLPHSVVVHAFGLDILLLDLPWLIHVKRAAGRPKDFEVIAELEVLRDEV